MKRNPSSQEGPLERQPSDERDGKARNRYGPPHGGGLVAAIFFLVAAALALLRDLGDLAVAGNRVLGLADNIVLDPLRLALLPAKLLHLLNEPHVRAVVERRAAVADRHDLQRGVGALLDVGEVDGELGDAEGAAAGGVPEVGGEGNVEVCDVLAEAEVDEHIGPVVVEVEGEGAAGDGPVGAVSGAVGDVGA